MDLVELQLSVEEQEQLAGLLSLPIYARLLEIIRRMEQEQLNIIAALSDDTQILSAVKYWQALHKVIEFLFTFPSATRDELERLKQEGQYSYDPTIDPLKAWAHRLPAAALQRSKPVIPPSAFAHPEDNTGTDT